MRRVELSSWIRPLLVRWTVDSAVVTTLLLLTMRGAYAQSAGMERQDPLFESIRQGHMVHVSPHLIVLDPSNTSAPLEFSNTGDKPIEADVVIQLGYTIWQNRDTVLFSPTYKHEGPRDTVIGHPDPKQHYAGPWLSGIPTHLVLAPHQTQRVTLRINPPKDLPNGEYYARIVTLAGPKRNNKSLDAKPAYQLPIVGRALPLVRDSVRLFYRQGPQSMGLVFPIISAQRDPSSHALSHVGLHPLWTLVRMHLTGTAHFEGYISGYYETPSGARIYVTDPAGDAFTLHTDGIDRRQAETDMLSRGHYTFVMRFIQRQDEFPPSQRVPMDTAQVSIPVDIP